MDKSLACLIKKDVVFKGKLNAINQSLDQKGLWKIQIYVEKPYIA